MMKAADVNQEANLRAEVDHLLAAVLDSRVNQASILRYLAECHLRGDATAKEYSIAVDALNRGEDFDPKKDAIVRVEVHKLRRTLKDYYSGPGRQRSVHIGIAAGKYALELKQSADGVLESGNGQSEVLSNVEPPPALPLKALPWKSLGGIVAVGILVWAVYLGVRQARSAAPQAASTETPAPASGGNAIRILCGAPGRRVMDSSGALWEGDRYFSGGHARTDAAARIHNVPDQMLYQSYREGDFAYEVPLPPGDYEVRLHFAETLFGKDNASGGGEASRLFAVYINGDAVEAALDVMLHAGGANLGVVKVYPGRHPAPDGKMRIRFGSLRNDKAFVNAIEIVPGNGERMLPLRIAAGAPGTVIDAKGGTWLPDRYVVGGRALERTRPVEAESPQLFRYERFGRFEYSLPAVRGHRFTLNLWMAEQFFGVSSSGNKGSRRRVFDLHSNGQSLLRSFSAADAAGKPLTAVRQTFPHLLPDAQGNIRLTFVPIDNYPVVNALELLDEGPVK